MLSSNNILSPANGDPIIVPAGTPGFTASKKYSKVGWNASERVGCGWQVKAMSSAEALNSMATQYSPTISDTDGPIMKFRRWYSQFYAEPVDAGAA